MTIILLLLLLLLLLLRLLLLPRVRPNPVEITLFQIQCSSDKIVARCNFVLFCFFFCGLFKQVTLCIFQCLISIILTPTTTTSIATCKWSWHSWKIKWNGWCYGFARLNTCSKKLLAAKKRKCKQNKTNLQSSTPPFVDSKPYQIFQLHSVDIDSKFVTPAAASV